MSAGGASPSASGQATNTRGPSQSPAQNQQDTGSVQARMPQRDQNEPTLAGNANSAASARGSGAANTAAVTNTDSTANPDDYAVVPGNALPQLRLDLHVYAAKPQERFALINMHKMHEGDSLQDGVRVESITSDGVVLSHNGSKFLLPRE
jgi:hypothetical protein